MKFALRIIGVSVAAVTAGFLLTIGVIGGTCALSDRACHSLYAYFATGHEGVTVLTTTFWHLMVPSTFLMWVLLMWNSLRKQRTKEQLDRRFR